MGYPIIKSISETEGSSINKIHTGKTSDLIGQIESLEKEKCNIPILFAEIFKDEINANNEQTLYNGIKRVVRKYSEDESSIKAITEFTRVIFGGASLDEIIQVTIDEAKNPSLTSELTVENHCEGS
jgi:hypothetical protein